MERGKHLVSALSLGVLRIFSLYPTMLRVDVPFALARDDFPIVNQAQPMKVTARAIWIFQSLSADKGLVTSSDLKAKTEP
jgi:hypothetical protein